MNLFTKSSPLLKNQPSRAFTEFYDRYAPPLWGLILLANLSPSQSEAILINTMLNVWKQVHLPIQSDTYYFPQILRVAYREGLPKNSTLVSTLRQTRHG
ncbi:hypothetical protein GCM10028808_56960 [Spirosoma migulaei]